MHKYHHLILYMLNPKNKILKQWSLFQCVGGIQLQDWSRQVSRQLVAKRWMKSVVLERLWHVDVQVSGKLHCSC